MPGAYNQYKLIAGSDSSEVEDAHAFWDEGPGADAWDVYHAKTDETAGSDAACPGSEQS